MRKNLLSIIVAISMILAGNTAIAAPSIVQADALDTKETKIPIKVENATGGSYQAKIMPMQEQGVALDLNTVMLGGKVTESKSSGNGRKQLTITWDRIVTKDKTIPLANSFKTVADTKKGSVPSGTELKARGDIAALKDALNKLSEATPNNNTGVTPKPLEARNTGSQGSASTGGATAATTSSLPMGTTSSSTTPQNQTTIPAVSPTFTSPTTTTSSTPKIDVSTDGCDITIDRSQNAAFVQVKITTNGEETMGCQPDPDQKYPITQDFSACQPKIDGTTYTPMFTLGYLNPKTGQRVIIPGGQCQSDSSVPAAAITDTADGCTPTTDIPNRRVIVQVRSVYNLDGEQKEYKSCHESAKTYSINEVVDSCAVSKDATKKLAIQQTKLSYTDDTGKSTIVRDCTDSANPVYSYPITQDFAACQPKLDGTTYTPMFTLGYISPALNQRVIIPGGECQSDASLPAAAITDSTDGCAPRIDYTNKQVIPQVRSVYTIDGQQKEYKACHDSSKVYAMKEVIDTCSINSQLANRVSTQQVKLAYTDDAGQTTIVRDCADSSNPAYIYTISPDNSACSPKIEGSKVYQQFNYGYVDPTTKKRVIVPGGDCQTDITVPAVDIVDGTDGCAAKYDFTNKIATVQVRSTYTMDNKVTEYKPCHDSAKTYTMSEGADNCPVSHYLDKQVSIQQTKMTYKDDSGQTITARDCTDSTTASYSYSQKTITTSCSVRADFTQMVAYPQSKIVYTQNGAEHVIQDCSDDGALAPYAISSTREGCNPVQTATTITPLSRKYITVNGMPAYLNSCTAEDSLNIVAEECTGTERFSNDFNTGQSYRNYSHYYVDGSNKIVLDHCVPGTTPYQHQPDVASCSSQNDDTAHTTQYYAKTFITVDGQNVVIKDCSASGNPVPYTLKNRVLTVLSQQTNKELSVDSDNDVYFSTPISSAYPNRPIAFPAKWKTTSISATTDPYGNDYYFFGMTYTGFSLIFSGKNYCINNELSLPTWVTTDNLPIDKEKSDQVPTFSHTTFNSCNTTPCVKDRMEYYSRGDGTWQGSINAAYGGLMTTGRTNTITYTCTKPKCANFTRVGKAAVYVRGNSTEFTDKTDISDTVNVCGTGSKLQ